MNANINTYAYANETGAQLRERLGVSVRAFQVMWKRRLGYSFNANRACSPEEIVAMEAAYQKKGKPAIRRRRIAAPAPAKKEITAVVDPEKPKRPLWPLFLVMAFCVSVTAPNMFGVVLQVKAAPGVAIMFTACFTLAPFLLIYSGVRGPLSWMVIALIIAMEIFCNTCSIYGGLTSMDDIGSIHPTRFLNVATGFAFNSGYEGTARFISIFFSLGIAALMALCAVNLRKQ